MAEATTGPGSEGDSLPASSVTNMTESQNTGQLRPPQGTEDVILPQRIDFEQRLLNIPVRDRIAFVRALPPDQQVEALRILKLTIAGGAETPDYLKEAVVSRKSDFQNAREMVELSSQLSATELTALITAHPDLSNLLTEATRTMNETLRPTDAAAQEELQRVLYFVRDDIRRVYTEAMRPSPRTDSDSWYGAPPKSQEERLKTVDEALRNYEERFWDYGEATLRRIFGETADIRALRQKYEGVASYVAARAVTAISKELRDIPLQPAPGDSTRPEFGDYYLVNIKNELGAREGRRREERKRATADERLHYNNWREKFDFTWAETAEELDDSVEDWLDYFQQQLPLEAEEAVYQEVTKGMTNALASLEQARNRIGLEANSVVAQQLREKIVGHVTTIAGARLLESRGGFEYFIKLRTDFAANYNGYYDGIYKKKGFAVMADKLSEDEGAIYRGGPNDLKKPLAGDTKTFRGNLEREAIRYGTTHDLYITDDDIGRAILGEEKIRREVSRLGLSPEEAEEMVRERLKERLGRYGWGEDDAIEELLLEDSRGLAQTQALTDPQRRAEAIARVQARTGVFRTIKEVLDKEDGFYGKTPDERKEIIRRRIRDKMAEEGDTALLQEIAALPDQVLQDMALWKWVRDYNKPRIELRKEGSTDEPWFPSLWDMERLSISKPEDLIDRALSKDELKAMVEEIDDPYKGLTDEQISRRITDEFRAQVQREVEAKNLPPEDAKNEFDRLMEERQEAIRRRFGDVLFERRQRETRAMRNYNLNIAQDKFLGLQARWGGLTTRVVNENGEIKMVTIYSEAEKILKAKIDAEAAKIERKVDAWRPGYVATHPGLTAEQLEEATIKQRRLLRRNATFAATLGLREIGIANGLPIWNYFYYGDVSQIGAFAPLVGYTDDEKGELLPILDAGRREMEAVFNFLAEQHMDGRILVVKDEQGLVIEDENGVRKDAHEESRVRPRVINEGGVLKLRDLFESRFMISTSGGVEMVDLISKIADLGIFDELWEHGCLDKREWQGFRKRRNIWELRQQSFFNIREWADPITYVRRLAGAAEARKFLVGGEVQGQGHIPGVLIEPMSGAYKYRDRFYDRNTWLEGGTVKNKLDMGDKDLQKKVVEELNKLDNFSKIDPKQRDVLVEIGVGIIKPLIDYMNARRYVMNRADLAPKNWKYDNDLIVNAYFNELFNEAVMGSEDLGYAPEGRTPIAVKVFRDILQTSTYHILVQRDRESLGKRAEEVKTAMDAMRRNIVAQGLPPEVQRKITNRVNNLRSQGMGQRIDSLTRRLQGLGMSQAAIDALSTIDGQTKSKLIAQGVSKEVVEDEIRSFVNMRREVQRLEDQYYDEQLHKQFVGEWPARLLVT